MGDELIGQDGGVLFDLDEVEGEGGHLGQEGTT